MEKLRKTSTEKPVVTVDPIVKEGAQAAIATLFKAMQEDRRAHIFWYNVVGTNKGILMHRMGINSLVFCALMLVAGLVEFRRFRETSVSWISNSP